MIRKASTQCSVTRSDDNATLASFSVSPEDAKANERGVNGARCSALADVFAEYRLDVDDRRRVRRRSQKTLLGVLKFFGEFLQKLAGTFFTALRRVGTVEIRALFRIRHKRAVAGGHQFHRDEGG